MDGRIFLGALVAVVLSLFAIFFASLDREGRIKVIVAIPLVVLAFQFKEPTMVFITLVLVLALVIPDRLKLMERAWATTSPRLDSIFDSNVSDSLSSRFGSSVQSAKDGWKLFRKSLLSVIGLLMVIFVIDISIFADEIAQQHQDESLTGEEKWNFYIEDPETGAPIVTYAYKELSPFSGTQIDSVISFPSDDAQRYQLDIQASNGDDDNDGDLLNNFYDTDDDNDGIMDFMDFLHPLDFDEDWNSTCDTEIWFDNSTNMYCGPDYLDLDDDGDGIADYDEVNDDDPLTDIYDTDNDGLQEASGGSAAGSSANLRVHHDTGADPSTVGITIFSVSIDDDENSTWSCEGCAAGSISGNYGVLRIDADSGEWTYSVTIFNETLNGQEGPWGDNFTIIMTDSSGSETNSQLEFLISPLDEAPITPNVLTSPAGSPDDEWYSVLVPEKAEMRANLSVESGSDYNLYLYTEDGRDLDSSRLNNGCPDFYSYDWMPEGYELCPFGTTPTGHDVLSKILYGSRKSLAVGFTVALVTCFLGLVIGGISGYFGGYVDETIMRIADVFFAIPGLILALALVAAMEDVNDLGAIGMEDVKLDRLEKVMIALIFTGWPGYSRIIRGQVLYVKEHTYVEAARSVGSNDFRILFRHVLPNAWAPMLVAVSLDVGGTILTAAGLSFIGLGAEELSAEWGKMISDGRDFFPEQWWLVTFPGIAILVTTLGFNLLGDGLRDVFDPKQRRSKS